jgi:hypothetical protein
MKKTRIWLKLHWKAQNRFAVEILGGAVLGFITLSANLHSVFL